MSYAIETNNLTKVYGGEVLAVDQLNLKLEKGKIYGFLGPNGAGKTTTMHMIMGILPQTEGSLKVLDTDPFSSKKFNLRKKIGFMPQDVALYDDLTPLEHCIFYGRLAGMKKKAAKKSAIELLKMFNLEDKMNKQVHSLSGGMKRRTSLIVALVHNPELLILDEPTVGVDPVLRRDLWLYFRKLVSEKKVTFLVTTHVFDEVERMDEILLIHKGKLIEKGMPSELKTKYNVNSLEEIFLNISDEEIAK